MITPVSATEEEAGTSWIGSVQN